MSELEVTIAVPMNDVFSPEFISMLDPRFSSSEILLERGYSRKYKPKLEEIEKPW